MGACYSHQQEKNLIVFEGRDVCECVSQWKQSKNSSAKGAILQEYHFRVKEQVFKIDNELTSQPNHPDWQGFLISDVSTPLKLEMWILHTTDQSIQASQEKRIRSIEKLEHNNILSYYYHMKSSFKLVVFRETLKNEQTNNTSTVNNTIPASLLSQYISSNRSKISSTDCFELCDDLAKGLLCLQDNNIKQNQQPQPDSGNTTIKTTSVPQAAIVAVDDLYVIQHTLKIDAFFAGQKGTSTNAIEQTKPSSSSTDILRLITIRLLLNLPSAEETDFNDIYYVITNKGKITTNAHISLSFLKTTPLQLKEFISWNINPIRTLRPNVQEIEKELDILRKDAQVVQYINQLYLANNQINQQDEIQEDQGQQSLHLPRQKQSYSLNNSSISSQILPSPAPSPLLSVHNPQSTVTGVIHRKQAGYNPEELLKTKFQFFEETYEIASYLGATQYSILFRVDNIKKSQQKSLMLRLSKSGIDEEQLHTSQQYPGLSRHYNNTIEEEYNILKQFHCKSIIRVYSLLMIRSQFPGIIMSLPNTDLREYLISSQKLNIAGSLLDYLESMVSGVHELHVRSIVHNNLSFKAVCLVNKEAVLTNLEYARAPQRLEKEGNEGNQGMVKDIHGENMNESNGLGDGNVVSSSSQQLLQKSSNPFNSVMSNSNSIVGRQVSLKVSKTTTTHAITKLQTLSGNTQGNNPMNVLPFVNEYSAPEVRDQIYSDYASDVYSLGLLVLSSLCNVSQEKLRRVTEAAYNPLPLSSDHYTSHLDRNTNTNRGLPMLQSTVGFMQQSTLTSSLRDILGQKCPIEIINGFESMIAKNPEGRGQCSDYLPIFQQLKSLPHVIEYINAQNKLARFI